MVKVDVITGFLGVGKTTLMRHLIASAFFEGKKAVVIVNEFGKVGIDGALMNMDGLMVFEIANGCICCSLKEDFKTTLIQVLNTLKPEHILIEPSGIFTMEDLMAILKEPQIASHCRLNSVITVVDAGRFLTQQKLYTQFFTSQISHATVIFLNKVSCVHEADLALVAFELNQMNGQAQVVINHDDAFKQEVLEHILQLSSEKPYEPAHVGQIHRHQGHTTFEAHGLYSEAMVTEEKMQGFIDGLKSGLFGQVIRAKGIFRTPAGSFECQYVEGSAQWTPFKGHVTAHKVSLIGRALKKTEIEAFFTTAQCI